MKGQKSTTTKLPAATAANQGALEVAQASVSERFMNMVIKEFGSGVGEIALTKAQKRLAQNYFMAIDTVLKVAEEKRLKKSEKYRDQLAITWNNVNKELLARNVVAAARIGWDPLEKNHVHMIPYKNNTTNLYDIGFIPGYRGLELKAEKYSLGEPPIVICELVYSNDNFQIFKKGQGNEVESYIFNVENPFNRGEIVGGFYYHSYKDPARNRLVVMSLADILKRKPKYASTEFWGGEKDVWEKNEKTGRSEKSGTEKVDGWFDEMCLKTIKRAAYGNITIDSQKVDDNYQSLLQNEVSVRDAENRQEYEQEANKEAIDITATNVEESSDQPPPGNVDTNTGEMKEEEPPLPDEPTGGQEMSSQEADKALAEQEDKQPARTGRAPF